MSDDNRGGKPPVDWEAVELDYRAGILTFDQMAERHGVSKGRISQKAKKHGWERDLAPKIKAEAKAKLARDAVVQLFPEKASAIERAKEAEVIEANAQAIVQVVKGQRTDIRRMRALVEALMGELAHLTEHRALYEQLGELLHAPDDNGVDKLNDLYRKVIALPTRIDCVKKLVEALRIAIALEREAYNIESGADLEARLNDDAPPLSPQDAYLRMIGK